MSRNLLPSLRPALLFGAFTASWLAVSCDTKHNSGETGSTDGGSSGDGGSGFGDSDGDGHNSEASGGDDCNDNDPDIYPGADEICDGKDNNCDGVTDNDSVDAETWYRDGDGDAYGDDSTGVEACEQPTGSVSVGGDCDDSESTVFPGADEYCDALDNDCDDQVDEDTVDGAWYFTDADGDQLGAAGTGVWACAGVDNDLDCNDSDPTEPQVVSAHSTSSYPDGSLDDPWRAIQDGIDNSTDCVVVFAGTYTENIDFGGSDIVVAGIEGAERTIIDGSDRTAPVVTFDSGESSKARLVGFTITGGSGSVEASSRSYACTSTTTCTDYYSTWCGGGIYIDGASPTLSKLLVVRNVLPPAGVIPSGNDTYYTYSFGGGICAIDSDTGIADSAIAGNFADQGGGLYLDNLSSLTLTRGWVLQNSATDGGGVLVDQGSLSTSNIVSAWNAADDDGGGVLVIDGTLSAVNVTWGDETGTNGGAVYLSGSSSGTIINTIISGASVEGVLVDSGSSFNGRYNDVYGNVSNYSGTADPTGTNGNISSDPLFVSVTDDGNPTNDDWTLRAGSLAIDAGDSAASYNDADGTRNDIGAFGGPFSEWAN